MITIATLVKKYSHKMLKPNIYAYFIHMRMLCMYFKTRIACTILLYVLLVSDFRKNYFCLGQTNPKNDKLLDWTETN